MTKLVDLTGPQPKSLIEGFQNRVVCDMVEYYMIHPMLGKYRAWIGSVEEEYFSIVFMAGFLTVSLDAREGCCGFDVQKYACTERVYEALMVKDDAGMKQIISEYSMTTMMDDFDNLTTQDVMDVLKWTIKPGAHVQKDMLNP